MVKVKVERRMSDGKLLKAEFKMPGLHEMVSPEELLQMEIVLNDKTPMRWHFDIVAKDGSVE